MLDQGWKRKCFGTLKFLRFDGTDDQRINVLAHEFGTCLLRLREMPTEEAHFELSASQEYPFNWEFVNSQGEATSIRVLDEAEFQEFHDFWQVVRTENTAFLDEHWINLIHPSCFQDEPEPSGIYTHGYTVANPT